jgi:hypothetical protein
LGTKNFIPIHLKSNHLFYFYSVMNDIQLYQYYLSIPLSEIGKRSRIYPKYVLITGRSFAGPHPHRHYTIDEFAERLNDDFRNVILDKAPIAQ